MKNAFDHVAWIQRHFNDKGNRRKCKKHYRLAYDCGWLHHHASDVWTFWDESKEIFCFTARPRIKHAKRVSFQFALNSVRAQ